MTDPIYLYGTAEDLGAVRATVTYPGGTTRLQWVHPIPMDDMGHNPPAGDVTQDLDLCGRGVVLVHSEGRDAVALLARSHYDDDPALLDADQATQLRDWLTTWLDRR